MSDDVYEEKVAFFAQLYATDSLSDDDSEDRGLHESERMLASSRTKTKPVGEGSKVGPTRSEGQPTSVDGSRKLLRTTSAPANPPRSARFVLPKDSTSLRRTQSSSGTSSRKSSQPISKMAQAIPRAPGRKRKHGAIDMMPEEHQIFKGLRIYFFPNSDTNAARRMRITKAIQYGASWLKEWTNEVSHVVLDKGMACAQLVRFLKVERISVSFCQDLQKHGIDRSKSKVIIVSENYLSDCISYHMLLDPHQQHYAIKDQGNRDGDQKGLKRPPLIDAPNSLQLKQVKRSKAESTQHTTFVSNRPSDNQLTLVKEPVRAAPVDQPDPPRSEGSQYKDDLQAVIHETNALNHLPLDSDEERSSNAGDPIESSSDSEHPRPVQKFSTKQTGKSWQEQFQCMSKHTGRETQEVPNARTIEVLQQMCSYYERVQDQWRVVAYRKAIASLRKQTRKISTKEEASTLPFVGQRVAAKIEEIVLTNRLKRLDNTSFEPGDAALQKLLGIYGVGVSLASRWVGQGFRSLEDLVQSVNLTSNQRIGIEHYDDFNARIPRAEAEEHGEIVKDATKELDPSIEVHIMGSYRRGALTSGDIDLIFTKPQASNTYLRDIVMDTLVPKLRASGFLKAELASTHRDEGTKLHGASCLPGSQTWRRIDFLLVPWEQIGAAFIYFTGNDIFNRSIRLLARRKGMRLNQRGLYKDVLRGRNAVKLSEGELVEGQNERKIFEILGVPWRPPEHRNC